MVLVGEAEPYADPDEPERTAPARQKLVPRFIDALGASRLGLSEIAARLDMNPKDGTLRRVAEDLEGTGEIVRGEDKKYARCQVPGATGPKGPGTVALGTSHSKAENGPSCTCRLPARSPRAGSPDLCQTCKRPIEGSA